MEGGCERVNWGSNTVDTCREGREVEPQYLLNLVQVQHEQYASIASKCLPENKVRWQSAAEAVTELLNRLERA